MSTFPCDTKCWDLGSGAPARDSHSRSITTQNIHAQCVNTCALTATTATITGATFESVVAPCLTTDIVKSAAGAPVTDVAVVDTDYQVTSDAVVRGALGLDINAWLAAQTILMPSAVDLAAVLAAAGCAPALGESLEFTYTTLQVAGMGGSAAFAASGDATTFLVDPYATAPVMTNEGSIAKIRVRFTDVTVGAETADAHIVYAQAA